MVKCFCLNELSQLDKIFILCKMRTYILGLILLLASCSKTPKENTNLKHTLPSVTFIAAGDIMLDRGTERIVRKKGLEFPFNSISHLVHRYDIAFCNLESIISNRGRPIKKPITFEADTAFISILKESGFNVINLANNHALDYGRKALSDCMDRLKRVHLYTVGAGINLHKAYRPLIIEKNSLKIAFLAYCTIPTGVPVKEHLPHISVFNLDTAISTIKRLRDTVDFIIVSLHWGIEYQHHPTPEQQKIAHRLIDEGADIIIGHHPHVIQEFELYRGKPIVYSLGNFIFDQRGKERNEGILFSCTLKKDSILDIVLWPIKIVRTQPRLLNTYEETKFIRQYKDILKIY